MKLGRTILTGALVVSTALVFAKTTLASSSDGSVDQWDEIIALPHDINAQCYDDHISAESARGRVLWSIRHYPETIAQFYSYIMTGTTDYREYFGDLPSTLRVMQSDFLTLPGTNNPRQRPKYPLWGSGPGESVSVWSAPTTEDAPADKPPNVSIRGLCTSYASGRSSHFGNTTGNVLLAGILSNKSWQDHDNTNAFLIWAQ